MSKGQEATDCDLSVCRHGVVERAVHPGKHPHVRHLRKPPVNRILQADPALIDERQGRRAGDRLGRRGDPEQGVASHWPPVYRQAAEGFDVDLVTAGDQCDQARRPVRPDVSGRDLAEMRQSRRRQLVGDARTAIALPRPGGQRAVPWPMVRCSAGKGEYPLLSTFTL